MLWLNGLAEKFRKGMNGHIPIGQQINACFSRMRGRPSEGRTLRAYRFKEAMVAELNAEARATNQSKTRVLEMAWKAYLSLKPKHRPS
jgi:hypothetical protein